MSADAAKIAQRGEELIAARSVHETTWRECADYSFPLRGDGLGGDLILDASTGQTKRAELLDGTATDACRVLASALQNGLTPSNALWAMPHVPGADDEGKAYLDNAARILHEEIHTANFDAAGFECMLDMTWAGWFGLYVDEGRDGFHFEQWPLAELYCASSVQGGGIDIVYRKYSMTALQAMQQYGNKLSAQAQQLAASKPNDMLWFWRAIYPRTVYDPQARIARNMRYASCTVEIATKHLVIESGYQELPIIVPRWSMLPRSVYAVGPMFDALPDTKELNELKLMEKQAAALNILPPFKARDDGVLNVGSVKRLRSGKLYAVEDIDNIQPIVTNSNFQLALTSEERLQAAIRRTLMADQLQWKDGSPQMTATEVHARIALIRQMLGPIYGRLQAEYLTPLFERCYAIAARAGILGVPPESIANQPYTVKYQSPLARAQKLEDVTAIQQFVSTVAPIVQLKPAALDLIDEDDQVRKLADALGVKVRSAQEAAQYRQQVQQQQQAQQQQAQLQNTQQAALQSVLDRSVKQA
jgi:hypothetical protein